MRERYAWSHLNSQQLGAYAEYFVKMEMTMYGFQVYDTEVDDRGIDFVARYERGPFIEVQVKSLRKASYAFMHKAKFELSLNLYLAFVIFLEGKEPDLYLIPSIVWRTPNAMFVDRPYGNGLKSKPEWGLNLSRRNSPLLEIYQFQQTVAKLINPSNSIQLSPDRTSK